MVHFIRSRRLYMLLILPIFVSVVSFFSLPSSSSSLLDALHHVAFQCTLETSFSAFLYIGILLLLFLFNDWFRLANQRTTLFSTCYFLVTLPFLVQHPSLFALLSAFLFTGSVFAFYKSVGDATHNSYNFLLGLIFALISVLVPNFVYLLPLGALLVAIYSKITTRSFFAYLIGVVFVYYLYTGFFYLADGIFNSVQTRYHSFFAFSPFDYDWSNVSIYGILGLLVLSIYSVFSYFLTLFDFSTAQQKLMNILMTFFFFGLGVLVVNPILLNEQVMLVLGVPIAFFMTHFMLTSRSKWKLRIYLFILLLSSFGATYFVLQ